MRYLLLIASISCVARAQDLVLDDSNEAPSQHFEVDSNEARNENQFVIGAEVFGFAPLPGVGLSASYFNDPDFGYEAQVTWGGFGRFERSDYLQGNLMGRWFFADTESLNFGLGYQKVTKNGQDILGNISDSKKSISSVGVSLSIGSRWQWSQWIWGVDWLGVYVPVKVTDRTFRDDEGNVTGSNVERDLLAHEKAKLTLNLFRTTVGFAP